MTDEEMTDEEFEECQEDGVDVYTHVVDSDSAGGASASSIKQWKGKFWMLSDAMDPSGPYDSLAEAVRESGISMLEPEVTHEVKCASMSSAELCALILAGQFNDEPLEAGIVVTINGERFVTAGDGALNRA